MRIRRVRAAGWALVGGLTLVGSTASATDETRRITRTALEDKVRGGWAGKMIGVGYGAPTEFQALGRLFEAPILWAPEKIGEALNQDDLYVGMTLAETMDRLGLEATTEQYGEAFKDSRYSLWHANAGARRRLVRGIKAPLSGHPRYNAHANDIDFQIEADFIGLMCPGLPQESNRLCERVGRVMNYGDGLYGGMFLDGMYAAAFFEPDPRRVVEEGLACLPPASAYARLIRDVLDWSAQNPDWRRTWQLLEEKWDRDDACPQGAGAPFNIDAKLNGAYIALGLLYGGRDFARTLEIATRSGQDSDCNASSAAGVLGVMLGLSGIPEVWKSGLPAVADKRFAYTESSFNDIVRSTLARTLKVVARAGGTIAGDEIRLPVQRPLPAPLEQWDMGVADRRLVFSDAAWSWKGSWREEQGTNEWDKHLPRHVSYAAGNEATLTFAGTAVAVLGDLRPSGGRADVFLDGRPVEGLEAWIPPDTYDDAVWHAYALPPGAHTLRIVTRADADPRSSGQRIEIREAVVFRDR